MTPDVPNQQTADANHALREAREREAATREILEVISRSRDDEQPVFDVILKNARKLCDAPTAGLVLARPGDAFQTLAAHHGGVEDTINVYRDGGFPMDPEVSFGARAILERRTIHLNDMRDTDEYRAGVAGICSLVDNQGIRTNLLVPLVSGEEGIGCIILFRNEVRPYTRDQIALVETFAAQAVIAIENVRQFRELETRLEREAATREILQAISQSRSDTGPVFKVILENARRLCNAPMAMLSIANEQRTRVTVPASLGAREAFAKALESFDHTIDEPLIAVRPVADGQIIHMADCTDDALYHDGHPTRILLADLEGVRTILAVPMISNGISIGAIILYRREVQPFDDGQIELVKTFADQAAIAVENVRQFRAIQAANAELETRLEREAATREILEVISRSREDEQPILDAIVRNAARLCGAPMAAVDMPNAAETELIARSYWGDGVAPEIAGTSYPLDGTHMLARSFAERITIHNEDIADDDLYRQGHPIRVRNVDEWGLRTILCVPLVKDDRALGVICIFRCEVKPFSDDDIALVETFAAQAVIAIENVRQFKALEARTQEVQALNASLEDRVAKQVGEIERMGRLKRFLPPAVADAVISSGSDKMLSSHRALLGILFCDIRGFTAFCETAEPEETIEVLQTYHEEMGRLIAAHGAGVDHRSGDGIMVIFNDPLPCDDPAGDALKLALAMRERMVELCKGWKRLGHRLGFGVGISLGYATVGMVGSEGRYEYTASGTAVNLASRLCDEAADGEILLSPRAFTAIEDVFDADPAGELDFKGFSAPVEVYRIVGPRT